MKKNSLYWDSSWHPITGCSHSGSPGCDECWAKALVKRFPALHGHFGGQWTDSGVQDVPLSFDKIQFHPERLDAPMKWKKPRRIFVCSMSDLFHKDVDFDTINGMFKTMCHPGCLHHTFLILTKRPERMADFFKWSMKEGGAGNNCKAWRHIWLGVTAENQRCADERIPILLDIPAAVRFVSIEPMLSAIDLSNYIPIRCCSGTDCGCLGLPINPPYLDFVIIGAESGPGRRPCKIEWMIDVVRQCDDAGVPVFVKQIHDVTGRVVKDINDFPKELQRREYPT